jgi:hypothetical protein
MNTHEEYCNKYVNVLTNIRDYDSKCNYSQLSSQVYLYSMNQYQTQMLNNINRSSHHLSIKNEINIFSILFNLSILTLNYLEIIGNKSKDEIINDNYILFKNKNRDYGCSFQDFELIGILVRLNDKINRIISLLDIESSTTCFTNEKIEDTLNDLYNYCIIGLMYK